MTRSKALSTPKDKQSSDTSLADELHTRDGFLNGRVIVSQPKSGFRAGIDSVLLAASVSENSKTVCEFGAGGGAAACCLLSDLSSIHMVLVEKQIDIIPLLEHNLSQNNISDRASILPIDLTMSGKNRLQAGLRENHFDCVIANPPFYVQESGTLASNRKKSVSNHMPKSDLEIWVKAAATSLRASGEVIFIMPAERLSDLLIAFGARFGGISILPIAPREGEEAHRILVRGVKGSRAPMKLLAPMVLHQADGRLFLPKADAIFRGEQRLLW